MPEKKQTVYTAPPNSVEAEQSLLCCILRNTDMQLEMISVLSETDFYARNHADIFTVMKELSAQNKTVNFASVVDGLRRNGKLEQVGDIDYITHLNELLPSASRYDEYLQIVKRAAVMRKLIEICGEVTKRAYSEDSSEKVIAYAEEEIFRLSQKGTDSELVDYGKIAAHVFWQIGERYKHPEKFHGLESGYKYLDRLTNGFHGGELIVLAARPGGGKSTMALNIAENVAKAGHYVAIFSLEMSNEQLIERLLSSMSGVPLESIKSGKLLHGAQDIRKLNAAHNRICTSMHIFGNDNSNVRPNEIRSQCRRLKSQNQLDMIVIDYIGLMQSDKTSENRQNEVANITRSLKIMAKELDVPVLALSQLKRDTEIRQTRAKGEGGGSSEPMLSDLRESGAIEQDADIVMFIYRENDDSDEITLKVAKHRNGKTDSFALSWLADTVRFVDPDYAARLQRENIAKQEDKLREEAPEEAADENAEQGFADYTEEGEESIGDVGFGSDEED